MSRFEAEPILSSLKDFQQATAEHAFSRMFRQENPRRRFLVADEVGLGKTHVARGLIAKCIEHLQDTVKRIDVIYVCSNAAIAAQNVSRLNVTGQKAFVRATRLTLLPLEVHDLKAQTINFVSFTPGTTFEHGNRGGHQRERHLIYQMLSLPGRLKAKGLQRLLQATAGNLWFERSAQTLNFDQELSDKFWLAVQADEGFSELQELSDFFSDGRRSTDSADTRNHFLEWISKLRKILANVCLDALEPDLVILDEFQRFRDLLVDSEDGTVGEIAHRLFNWSKELRILLLSATPYAMYASDAEQEDHYSDFIQTLRFLFHETPSDVDEIESLLRAFRRALLKTDGAENLQALDGIKNRIQELLRDVMSRTERVGISAALDSMMSETGRTPKLAPGDLAEWKLLDDVARSVGAHEGIEFWKSAPYALQFLGASYRLKRKFTDKLQTDPDTRSLVESNRSLLLDSQAIQGWEELDPRNAKLRVLVDEAMESGAWKCLWVPPSLPYTQPAGVFRDNSCPTKRLVFSSWKVVPEALAAGLSYAVDRQVMSDLGAKFRYDEIGEAFRPRIKFARSNGRVSGMMPLALAYPSHWLALNFHPLRLAMDGLADWKGMRTHVARVIESEWASRLPAGGVGNLVDAKWYWAALAMMDAYSAPDRRTWCESAWLGALTDFVDGEATDDQGGKPHEVLQEHLALWLDAWDGKLVLGRRPKDLWEVLAEIALGGHAVCAVRSLRGSLANPTVDESDFLHAAVLASRGLRGLFNQPESIAIVSSQRLEDDQDDSYWRECIQYGLDGNLQSLLDEHGHLLSVFVGGGDGTSDKLRKMGEEIQNGATIKSASIQVDRLDPDKSSFSIRCRYAVKFGGQAESESDTERKKSLQTAFNSPFRPFVLCSTSVGQEGLDFHLWCHSVVHWNLPTNPVDLEQREGRVHRFKGHAVRRNLGIRFGIDDLRRAGWDPRMDPWEILFELAKKERPFDATDLVPYWIYETPGGVKVERHLMLQPLGKDAQRAQRLRKSLVLYRMVFGQPRQDDLLQYLSEKFQGEEMANDLVRWRIDLSPDCKR